MELCRPKGLWAGFWAFKPDQKVPELIGAGEQWACDQWEVEWHQHAGWELHLQLQGNTLWKTNRAIYRSMSRRSRTSQEKGSRIRASFED